MTELRFKKFEEVDYFNFEGLECPVKIVDIYDGDTISVIFHYRNQYYKYRCRLRRINSDELHLIVKRENDTKLANQARIKLAEKILGCDVDLECKRSQLREMLSNHTSLNYCKFYDFDKYGRLLIELYETEECHSQNLNDFLINHGLANPCN